MKKIIDYFFSLFRRKGISGDFSSFTYACPVRDCGWYFQSEEMRQEHIAQGEHGAPKETKNQSPQ